eukprot:TRINITY_DN15470_c1_g1_i1.p1 TRINITY_DN15470_c1_g1~~TRINITY_DN15470_c1_g1_i1.p1  ORF type:complete len:2082 (+),score=412.41 TRINITY_DN15470_c1_g1_i1:540-6248(+)
MGYLCSKNQVIIEKESIQVTVGQVTGTDPVFITLRGNGLHSQLAIALNCLTPVSVAQVTEGGQGDGTTLEVAISPNLLEVGSEYEICWASSLGRTYTASGVTVVVAEMPVLSPASVSVAVHTLGSSIELSGSHLTSDIWVAVFSNSQCLGSPEADAVELVPITSSVALYKTPSTIGLVGAQLTVCISTSTSSPPLNSFSSTEVTFKAVPLPSIDIQTYYLTYSETFTDSSVLLTGQFFSQPDWTITLFYHSECLGTAVGEPRSMQCDNDSECIYNIPPGITDGKVLYLCLNNNMKTNVAILATSKPVPSTTSNTTTLSHAQTLMGSEIVVQVRNLETQGRDEADYKVSASLVVVSEQCSSPNGIRATFFDINPIKASLIVPSTIPPGSYRVCVVVGDNLEFIETATTIIISGPPQFDDKGDIVVSWEYYLKDESSPDTQIQVTATNIAAGHLWAAFSAGDCSQIADLSNPFNIAEHAEGTSISFPGKWAYYFYSVSPSDTTTELNLCWTASTIAPTGTATWVASGQTFQVLPPPVINKETKIVMLTSSEADAEGTLITITGMYLQEGIAWGVFVKGDSESVLDDTGTSVTSSSVTCVDAGTGWCTTATIALPTLTTDQTYQIGWITSLTAPIILPSDTNPTGITLILLGDPIVSKFEPIPSDTSLTYSTSLKQVLVPVSSWKSGFDLKLNGQNIGIGVQVFFGDDDTCQVPNSQSDIIDLVGDKDATETVITIAGQLQTLTHGGDHTLCLGMAGSSEFTPTGLTVTVLGIPVFSLITLEPTLEEIWDVSLIKTYLLEGSNLNQPGIYTSICKADCSGCVAEPKELVDRKLEIPRAGSPTSDTSFPATLCWGLGSELGTTLSASNVMIRYPSVPIVSDEIIQVPLLAESVSIVLSPLSPELPSGTWASICSVIDNQPGNELTWNKVTLSTSSFSFTRLGDYQFPNSHRLCITFSTVQPGTTLSGVPAVFSTPLRYKWQGTPSLITLSPQTVFLKDFFLSNDWSGPLSVSFTGSELLEVEMSLVPLGTDCSSDVVEYKPLIEGDDSGSKNINVNIDSTYWNTDSTVYRLCYAAGLEGTTSEGIDINGAAEVSTELVVTFESRPVFSKNSDSSTDVPPIVISRTSQLSHPSIGITLHGSGFSNKLIYIHVHDGATDTSACNPSSLLDVVIPDADQSTDIMLALTIPSSTLLKGGSLSGALSLCWSLFNANENTATPLLNTGTVLLVPGMPLVVDVSTTQLTLIDIMSGDAQIELTGKDIDAESGIWWGCDTSMPPSDIINKTIVSVPRWLGSPNPSHLLSTVCIGVIDRLATSASDRNLSAISPVPGSVWSLSVMGIPTVISQNTSVSEGEKVVIEGTNLAPSDTTPGVLFYWMPEGEDCPSASPSASIEAFADIVLLEFSSSMGAMKLCMGMRGGGGMIDTDVVVSVSTPTPPTPPTETPQPTDTPVVIPETDEPTMEPTDVPTDNPIPDTLVPTPIPTETPCKSVFEVSRDIRNECYLSEFGLLFCTKDTVGFSSFCGDEYNSCATRISNEYISRCYPDFEVQILNHKIRYSITLKLSIEVFDENIFKAAIAATALVIPIQVKVLRSMAGSTVVEFDLLSTTEGDLGDHSSQLSQSLTSSSIYFNAIGDDWGVLEFKEITSLETDSPPETAVPTTPPTVVETEVPDVNVTDTPTEAGSSSDSKTTLIIIIASSAAAVCCVIVIVSWWKLSRKTQQSTDHEASDASELGAGTVSLKPVVVPPMMKASTVPTNRVSGPSSQPSSTVLQVMEDSNIYSEDSVPTVDINPNSPPPRKEWMRQQSASDISFDDRPLHRVMSEGTRGWMLDNSLPGGGGGGSGGLRNATPSSDASSVAHFRNPLPSADLCNKCGATWEGGRYCAYCGSPYEVPEEDSPQLPSRRYLRPP